MTLNWLAVGDWMHAGPETIARCDGALFIRSTKRGDSEVVPQRQET